MEIFSEISDESRSPWKPASRGRPGGLITDIRAKNGRVRPSHRAGSGVTDGAPHQNSRPKQDELDQDHLQETDTTPMAHADSPPGPGWGP